MASLSERLNKRFNKLIPLKEDNETLTTLKQAIQRYEQYMEALKGNPAYMLSNDKPSKFYNLKTSEDKAKKAFETLFALEKALENAITCYNNDDNCDKVLFELESALDDASDNF